MAAVSLRLISRQLRGILQRGYLDEDDPDRSLAKPRREVIDPIRLVLTIERQS
ncbi:hypothetical protein [Chamaesiphon sp. OTE_20_metabat_361]|uniref:hypothetical protein n=1 Tax=Chamaesiphon sp. OTE_20_metabat_361 TaxID=2964689 RepID=UPI00286BDFD8|nr:hypothetical protein [Chamaesiphon sp. OTE_20_metabat_361]